ncbi:bile acid:sodium symporter family protein [Dissulfurirhabdus thermomarina]|uniref:Bile acid:sodium symporter family protein n=1 Tax=Dissulfurirhabdus thermomarina TaxID=1765737 RepID=A0A6N9TPE7_DISTH|nr:bile acid:sodium symporter family protein [Dissulfurirhabdus thermomarina]NMX22903.1 bile acid:sodium symporter family protein [Dissulfurirhabdus thermomarina]
MLTRWFVLWVLLASAAAVRFPGAFTGIRPWIAPLLGLIMFGMGMTLEAEAFRRALRSPVPLALGVVLQFLVMPLAGFGIAAGFRLPPQISAGLVLVGACPGGTASNVMVYLSRGNVALSIAMTTCSTLLAPLVTPWLTLLYARRWLPVDPAALFLSILEVVLVPVVLGLAVKRLAPGAAARAEAWTPAVSVLAIVAIVGCVVALNAGNLRATGPLVLGAVVLHNGLGLALGYAGAWILGQDTADRRAIALEVGMQNSGLGAALAHAHFGALAALPSAVFSVWHNVSGALLAGIWRRRPAGPGEGGRADPA